MLCECKLLNIKETSINAKYFFVPFSFSVVWHMVPIAFGFSSSRNVWKGWYSFFLFLYCVGTLYFVCSDKSSDTPIVNRKQQRQEVMSIVPSSQLLTTLLMFLERSWWRILFTGGKLTTLLFFSNSIILSKRTYMYLHILHVCFCYHNFITVIGLSASTQQWSHYSKKTLRHVDCCSNNICNTYFIHTSNFFLVMTRTGVVLCFSLFSRYNVRILCLRWNLY